MREFIVVNPLDPLFLGFEVNHAEDREEVEQGGEDGDHHDVGI